MLFRSRAIMAIAEIVQEQGFEEKWLGAKSEQELRDIILLANRRRDTPK